MPFKQSRTHCSEIIWSLKKAKHSLTIRITLPPRSLLKRRIDPKIIKRPVRTKILFSILLIPFFKTKGKAKVTPTNFNQTIK